MEKEPLVPYFFPRHFLPPSLSPFPSSSPRPVSFAVSSFFPLGPSFRRLRSYFSLSLSLFPSRSILIRARTSAQVNLRERMQNAMQMLIERNTRGGNPHSTNSSVFVQRRGPREISVIFRKRALFCEASGATVAERKTTSSDRNRLIVRTR